MLKRILIDATSLGIKRIVLINSWKVDKSYWQTPNLKAGLLREKMLLGLEQARDTSLPELILAPRFKPFVEDELDRWAGPGRRLLAHPGDFPAMPCDLSEPVTLAIGPEGGWTDYEVEMLQRQGFACHSFGTRILRVETALPALVGRLMRLP
jgi:RsmE family RNA methyltransferase